MSLCEFIMIFILIGRRIRYAFPCSIIAQGTPLSLFFCQERKTIFHLLEFSFFFFAITRSLIFLISLQFLLQAHFFFYSNVQFLFVSFSSFSISKLSRYNYIFIQIDLMRYWKAYWTLYLKNIVILLLIFLKKITLFLPLAMIQMCITHAVLMNKWFDDAKLSRNVSENNFRGKQYDLR